MAEITITTEPANPAIQHVDAEHFGAPPKVRRRRLIGQIVGLIFLGVVIGLGGWLWKSGRGKTLYAYFQRGTIRIAVTEGDTVPVVGAIVDIGSQSLVTNEQGVVEVQIPAGDYRVSVRQGSYDPKEDESVTVRRARYSEAVIALVRRPDPRYSLTYYVVDGVTGEPLANATLSTFDKTAVSTPDGAAILKELSPSTYPVTVTAPGYQEIRSEVIVERDIVEPKVSLTPNGVALFVTNREGRRQLFSIDFAGQTAKVFQTGAEGDDFGMFLPGKGESVVFQSTRGNLQDRYGNPLAELFAVDRNGERLRKLGALRTNRFTPIWAPGGVQGYIEGYTPEGVRSAEVVNVKDGTSISMDGVPAAVVFADDGARLAVARFATVTGADGAPVNGYRIKWLSLQNGERTTVRELTSQIQALEMNQGRLWVASVEAGKIVWTSSQLDGSDLRAEVRKSGQGILAPVSIETPKGLVTIRDKDGKRDLYLQPKTGKEVKLSSVGAVDAQFPLQLDATGRYVVFGARPQNENGVYIVSLGGGPVKKLTGYTVE
jgi:hypothetical protein